MPISYTALPSFRDPGPLDFSPLHSALDDWAKSREKNRLLEEAKAVGSSLQPAAPGQAPASYTAQPVNRLMSPAQNSAAAAGRDYPIASPGDPSLPAGMRNNNPGNIKYIPGAKYAGLVGPSVNRDQGDPQMVFDTPQNGMRAAADLALRKYQGGKRTATDLIAGNMGWTPGNTGAAANIARTMGVAPDEDLRLDDPQRMQTFLRALTLQEHGAASRGYGDDVYGAAAGGRSQTATAPQTAPTRSGMNYDAGIRTALQQGNVALATQLQNAKQEEENLTYTRGRQATQDAQAAESHALTTQGQRDELQKTFVTRVASLAQNIASDPDPASRTAKWNRLVSADPRFAASLRQAGIDPSDVNAGTAALIAEARGLTPAKPPVEVNGRLVQQQSDGSWKSVYDSPPKPAQLMAGDRKEVYESDESVRAGTQALSTLDHALELNGKAYSGLAPSTRAWISSQFGGQGGADTRELENITTRLALEQLKLTFGGQPTEGERAILLQVQGSLSETPEVRKRIFETAKQAVERRVAFNREQGQAIRSGGYFTPGYDPNAAAAGVRAPAQAAPQTTPDQNLPTVNTPEEADALPPGTRFRTPDGRIKTRP